MPAALAESKARGPQGAGESCSVLEVGRVHREDSACDLAQGAANADETRAAVKAGAFSYSTLKVAGHVLRRLVLLPLHRAV